MELTENIMSDIETVILQEYEDVYDKYIKGKTKISFVPYLKNISNDVWNEVLNLNELTDEVLNTVKYKRKSTKKRWEIKELEPVEDNNKKIGFNKEVYLTAFLFFEKFKDNEEVCMQSYNVKTFEEYKNLKIEELISWTEDDDKDSRHFPYLESKKPHLIETLLKYDIKYKILKVLKETLLNIKNEMITLPNTITNMAYDYTNKLKFKNEAVVSQDINGITETFFKELRILSDTSILESYLSVTALKEGLLAENVKMLNAFDKKILTYLMSRQDEEFYRTGTMNVRIGHIVRGIGYSDGEKNYTAVKQSLIKMRYIRNEIRDEKLRTIEVRLLNSVNIVVQNIEVKKKIIDENGNSTEIIKFIPIEFAQLEFSKDYVDEVVKNATTSVYTRIIEQLTLNISQILVYPMQRERLACWKENPTSEELILKVNRSFFSRIVLFTTNRRDRQIKVINSGLDEIIKSNFIIKDYKVDGDVYTIYFHPLSAQEIDDLSKNQVPSEFRESLEAKKYINYETENESIDIIEAEITEVIKDSNAEEIKSNDIEGIKNTKDDENL